MHTFEMICNISSYDYEYLKDNLPSLIRVSNFVERTNFYSAKGYSQIELKTNTFNYQGRMISKYYLGLRCNPSVIMGENNIFVLDMDKYTSNEIISRILKRLYEINEFRYIQLDKLPIQLFRASRIDVAKDIYMSQPKIAVWICNMSFPYNYHRMKRKHINKDLSILYFESCCFASDSRAFNLYDKWIAIVNTGKTISAIEENRVRHIFRLEIQIKKTGIAYMATKLPTKKSIQPFLEKDFCYDYLESEIRSVFGIHKYVSRSKAVKIINASQYKAYEKDIMISIIDMIQKFNGLYELEKAIADINRHTPSQYGNLRSFRERWLAKIRKLGIQPIVIPDSFGIDEIPSIYELLKKEQEKQL